MSKKTKKILSLTAKVEELEKENAKLVKENGTLKQQVQSLNNLIAKDKAQKWKQRQNLAVRQFLRRFNDLHKKNPAYFMLENTDSMGYWFKYKINIGDTENKWLVAHSSLTAISTKKS